MTKQPKKLNELPTKLELERLNETYLKLSVTQRIQQLYEDFALEDVMLTSSFATTSAYLLKLFSEVNKNQPVHFIDTGYHFPETLVYKDYLTFLYELKVIDVRADKDKHTFTQTDETWSKNPDFCCSINKVDPLQSIKDQHKIWVSGLMAWQSKHRSNLNIFEERNGIIKFYPLIDVSRDEREGFISSHHLPFHPLVSKGYFSVGCHHCTVPGEGREGRWNNNPKTECGLHL